MQQPHPCPSKYSSTAGKVHDPDKHNLLHGTDVCSSGPVTHLSTLVVRKRLECTDGKLSTFCSASMAPVWLAVTSACNKQIEFALPDLFDL